MVSSGARVPLILLTLGGGGAAAAGLGADSAPGRAQQNRHSGRSEPRAALIETTQIENLPIGHGNFMNAVAFTPGVNGTTRLGAPQDQNNIMMDGVSAMDTGNNGQMLNLDRKSTRL